MWCQDSGLPPENAGYVRDSSRPPVANTAAANVRITVRERNLAPEIITVRAFNSSGGLKTEVRDGSTLIHTEEGVPLRIEAVVRDADLDAAHWTGQALPRGMTVSVQPLDNGQTLLVLNWLPDYAAAQQNNGIYRFKLNVSDGSAQAQHSVEIHVTNRNQAPELAAMPLQLVREGGNA